MKNNNSNNNNSNSLYPPQHEGMSNFNRLLNSEAPYSSNQSMDEEAMNLPLLEHLDLIDFKSQPCQNPNQHNHKQCQFYHGPKDRRRYGNYSSDLCEFAENENAVNCRRGDMCHLSHNKVEQLYRPDKYKTQFCTLYPYNCHNCQYGPYCSFAHSENDIMIELIHNLDYDDDFYIFYYKTVWCPFNYLQHDRGQCVYAHNWQDYRRKPHVYNYDPEPCQFWNPNDFIAKYDDGCQNQYSCNQCHGWKQFQYHPKNYRSRPCTSGVACNKGHSCPYFHALSEKRSVPPNVQTKLFRFAPRNRIIKGTFKQRSTVVNRDGIQNMGIKNSMVPNSSSQSMPVMMDQNYMTEFGGENSQGGSGGGGVGGKGKIRHANTYNYSSSVHEEPEENEKNEDYNEFSKKDILQQEIFAYYPREENLKLSKNSKGKKNFYNANENYGNNSKIVYVPKNSNVYNNNSSMDTFDQQVHPTYGNMKAPTNKTGSNTNQMNYSNQSKNSPESKHDENLVKSMINSVLWEENFDENVQKEDLSQFNDSNNTKPFFSGGVNTFVGSPTQIQQKQ